MRRGVRAVLPLSLAAAAFGVSYGVLARTAGMGSVAPVVMSSTTFAGSAQFAAASILDEGSGAVAAILAAILLNVRYAPMSIAAAPEFRGPRWRRFLESQMIVDESWALSARGGGRFDVPFLVGAGLVLYVTWTTFTAVGVARRGPPRRSRAARTGCRVPGAVPRTARADGEDAHRTRVRARRRSDRARARAVHGARRPDHRGERRLSAGAAFAVSEVWTIVAIVGVATVAFRAAGPVLLGGRKLPPRLAGPIDLLAPAVLAALVVTQLVGGDRELVFDERLVGIAAAALAIVLRAPIVVVIVVAAATTALVRLVS